jgi:hypothetical protein
LANSLVTSYLAKQGSGAPVLTKITVSPSSASVQTGGTQPFTATGYDQFGNPMSPQPGFTWSVSGGGSISGSGLFTAGSTAGGPFTVTASSANVSGTASVTVTNVQATFTIKISPGTQTVTHPASGTVSTTSYTVTITPSGGFNSKVSLTANGARTGITLSLSPTAVTGPSWNSTLTATVSSNATHPRTRTITVTGTGNGITKSASATLVIQ